MTDDSKLTIWVLAFLVFALMAAAIAILTARYPGGYIDPSISGALTPMP